MKTHPAGQIGATSGPAKALQLQPDGFDLRAILGSGITLRSQQGGKGGFCCQRMRCVPRITDLNAMAAALFKKLVQHVGIGKGGHFGHRGIVALIRGRRR